MAVPAKIASCFGVLEYWSVGKSESPNFKVSWFFSLLHYSTTPSLQQTAAWGKEHGITLREKPKTRAFGGILYICHVLSVQNIAVVLIVTVQRTKDNAKCEMSNDR